MQGSDKVKGQLNNRIHRTTEMKAAREEDYITKKGAVRRTSQSK